MPGPWSRLQPIFTAALTSDRLRDLRRHLAESRRRRRGEPHIVEYFHQVDDPYSHLVAQVLEELTRRYEVKLVPWLVGPPPDRAAPDRARLEEFSRADAADVAPGYGLRFPATAASPPDSFVALAQRILARAIRSGTFVSLVVRVGDALWSGDGAGLETLARQAGADDESSSRAAVLAGSTRRERCGHYLGAMILYGGEWYWGVDRLWHLERRLQGLGALCPGAAAKGIVLRPRPPADVTPSAAASPVTVEFFLSLRSPYTWIAMERTRDLARRHGAELVLRPVLPMVMRGLEVPREKRIYILLDTKREADDAEVPFGRVCDPVGRPVERAFSLWPWARAEGREADFLFSFARAAFAEGLDTGSEAGLRQVVERAGLSWNAAREYLGREGWREELERNRQELLDLRLWGVPSFRVRGGGKPDYATWGQDRLWRVEEEVAWRRQGEGGSC